MFYVKTHGRGGSAPFVRACVALLAGVLVSGAAMNSTPGAAGLAAGKSAPAKAAPQVRIRNEEGAPVVVAKVALEKRVQPDPLSPTGTAPVVTVTLRNTTERRVAAFALSLDVGSRSSTSFQPAAEIAPGATHTLEAAVPGGDARQLVVGVVGVRFKDGSSWGSFPALPR